MEIEILCEISVRHIHLSQKDIVALFGENAHLQFERSLSQPGQFLSRQRVTLIGPKREMAGVAVLGPARKASQVEISQTDTFTLGLKGVPVRQSGHLDGAPCVAVRTELGEISVPAIVAKRHVHMDPKSAAKYKLTDGEIVMVQITSERGAILDDTVVRVDKDYAPAVHLDSDEGNAVFAGCKAKVIKKS